MWCLIIQTGGEHVGSLWERLMSWLADGSGGSLYLSLTHLSSGSRTYDDSTLKSQIGSNYRTSSTNLIYWSSVDLEGQEEKRQEAEIRPSVGVKTGCKTCLHPPNRTLKSASQGTVRLVVVLAGYEPRSIFLYCPVMELNLRHRRADFKTNPMTENDAGPCHLAGTRCKSHSAVSSRTIWQTNLQLDFNEKSAEWFLCFFFFNTHYARFFNWLINVAHLAWREIKWLCSEAAWISNRRLKGKDLQLRCLHGGRGTNAFLKGPFAQTSCFQQYSDEDKWHGMLQLLPKVKCKSCWFLRAWLMQVEASRTNQGTHRHTWSLTRVASRRCPVAVDVRQFTHVNSCQMVMPPVHLVEIHWKL